MNSASGGAFPVLANEVINQGGTVVGAAWMDNFVVKHILINKQEDIIKLQKSKYLQSYLGSTFKEIKSRLEVGKLVMFTGCPCQVAGLKKYLGKNYSNLLLVDLFCALCPSQMFFDKYKTEKFSDKILTFGFRAKTEKDKIWDAYTYEIVDIDGKKQYVRMQDTDYYKQPLLLTPSHCKKCKYQGTTRYGDLSIGDCWGIQNYDSDINPSYGVSAILVNNEKGQDFLNAISKSDIEILKLEPLDQIKKYNVCAFQENRNWPINPKREEFYLQIPNNSFAYSIRVALNKKT